MIIKKDEIIKARAPCRIGLAGGGTDIPEFFRDYGGTVLNIGINVYSYVSIKKIDEPKTRIISDDWGIVRDIKDLTLEFDMNMENNVDIVKGAMKVTGVNPQEGLEIHIHTTAKRNSGLAGSSALAAALLAAFYELKGAYLIKEKLYREVYHLERTLLRRYGGYQDQIAATYGGLNYITFGYDGKEDIIVNYPLFLQKELRAELHSSLLLFETPVFRKEFAHKIEEKKMKESTSSEDKIKALNLIKGKAIEMKDALQEGDMRKLGELLHESWMAKRSLPYVANEQIDELYKAGMDAGAYGGKLSGAGGGGFIFYIVPTNRRRHVIDVLEEKGAKYVNFEFDWEGVMTWRITEKPRI